MAQRMLVGRLEEFDPKSDSITAYIERAPLFLAANSVPPDKKVATLAMEKSDYTILLGT